MLWPKSSQRMGNRDNREGFIQSVPKGFLSADPQSSLQAPRAVVFKAVQEASRSLSAFKRVRRWSKDPGTKQRRASTSRPPLCLLIGVCSRFVHNKKAVPKRNDARACAHRRRRALGISVVRTTTLFPNTLAARVMVSRETAVFRGSRRRSSCHRLV